MKEVKAFIRPHRLEKVTGALRAVKGLKGMTVTDVRGFGRSVDNIGDFIPHAKVEVLCADAVAPEVVSVIERAAHTGLKGDGIVYVTGVEEALRIETGERGEGVVL